MSSEVGRTAGTASLKSEAENIIAGLGLLPLLSRYGTARVVGSVALDLIVKPDIDLHVLTRSDDLFAVACHVRDALLARGVKDVRLSDYRERGGVKVGIDRFVGREATWSVDIWITNWPEATGFALLDRLSCALTAEQRETILRLKRHFHAQGALHDGMSTHIYAAVMTGVRTETEFRQWLSDTARSAPGISGGPR